MQLEKLVDLEEEIQEHDHYVRGAIHGVMLVPVLVCLLAGVPTLALPCLLAVFGVEYVWWSARQHENDDPGVLELLYGDYDDL